MQPFHRHDTTGPDITRGLVGGLIGGLAASWVMGFVMTGTQRLQQQRSHGGQDAEGEQEQDHDQDQAQGEEQDDAADGGQGDSPTVKTAKAISRTVFRRELPKRHEAAAGQAVHYGFGGGVGALYGAIAEVLPAATTGAGLPFGAGLWLVADEAAVPLLRLAPPPTRTPALLHGGALLAHLVYGAVLDAVRCLLRRV